MSRIPFALTLLAVSIAGPALAAEPDAGAADAGTSAGGDEISITAASPAARAAFSRGRSLYYNLKQDDARAALLEAAKLDPSCALAWTYLALTSRPVSSGRDAIAKAEKAAVKATPGERLLVKAVAAQVRGDAADEEAQREALVQAFPRDWRALVGRGNRLVHAGRYTSAIHYLQRATEVAPDEAAPYNDLGYAYAYAGRLDEAIRALTKYAERLPSEPNPHDSLAEVNLMAGKTREAETSYRRALEVDPTFTLANEGLGHARVFSGDFAGAREAYQRLGSGSKTPYDELVAADWYAGSYVHEGRLDEALRQYDAAEKQALAAKEPSWIVLFPIRRALVLAEAGRTAEAVATADRAVKLAEKAKALGLEPLARALVAKGLAQARGGQLDAARKTLADLKARTGKVRESDPKLDGLVMALSAGLAASLSAGEAQLLLADALGGSVVADRANAIADAWELSLLADAVEKTGDGGSANDLRQRALKLNVMTPELGLVRPRLLAGKALAPGAHFGPVPVTTRSSAALALFSDARRIGEAFRRSVALAALESAVKLDPDFGLAWAYLAVFQDQPEEGADELAKAAKLAKAGKVSDGEKLFIDAQVAGAAGDATGKVDALRDLTRLYPNDWRPAMYLGEQLFRMNRRKEAIDVLKDAVKRAPGEAQPYNGLGYSLAYEGRFDEALQALQRYVELSPGESNPHDSLAEVSLLAGKPQQAELEYRRSLEISPEFVASYAGLGHARLFAGNPAGAREAYRQMLEHATLAVDRVEAQTWTAMTWAMDGKFGDAAAQLARFESEADAQKDRLGAAVLAARRVPMWAEAGRAKDAVALANLTLAKAKAKLSPAGAAVVRRQALFGRGWAQLLLGDLDGVDATAKELAPAGDDQPDRRTLAAILSGAAELKRGRVKEAAKVLEGGDSHHPLVAVLLAEAYERSGDNALARPLRAAIARPRANHFELALAWRRQTAGALPPGVAKP